MGPHTTGECVIGEGEEMKERNFREMQICMEMLKLVEGKKGIGMRRNEQFHGTIREVCAFSSPIHNLFFVLRVFHHLFVEVTGAYV